MTPHQVTINLQILVAITHFYPYICVMNYSLPITLKQTKQMIHLSASTCVRSSWGEFSTLARFYNQVIRPYIHPSFVNWMLMLFERLIILILSFRFLKLIEFYFQHISNTCCGVFIAICYCTFSKSVVAVCDKLCVIDCFNAQKQPEITLYVCWLIGKINYNLSRWTTYLPDTLYNYENGQRE
jgi:hypothetical protein